MSDLIRIILVVFFIGGFVGIAALWTQRAINKKREKNEAAVQKDKDSSRKE